MRDLCGCFFSGKILCKLMPACRYMPHVNVDPLQPRSPTVIVGLISYKNGYGAAARGGDVWIRDSK